MTGKMKIGLIALCSSLALVACADEDETLTPSGDTTTDTADTSDGSGDMTEEDMTEEDTTEEDTSTGEPPFCLGEADSTIIEGGEVTDIAGDCGLGCLGDADPEACAGACVQEATGLTTGCAGCYAATVKCAIDNCLADCAADPGSDACVACRGTNCDADFYECSGLTPSEPEPVPPFCTGEADLAIIENGVGEEAESVTDIAGDCGLGCLGDADPEACAGACVQDGTGLSTGCASCYAATVKCAIDNCLADCAADPGSEACVACRGTNCDAAFYECSGLPQD